jgi:hypothetical protein
LAIYRPTSGGIMKLFTINKEGNLTPYKEQNFKVNNFEADLENLLENNPEYFFESNKVLIIGRQVSTNFNTYIDLLGIDKNGHTIVIELKRDKTPRETVAQILEYAFFIDNLSYDQLNEIFKEYNGDESNLEDYHQQYFGCELDQKVSFNKNMRLIIIAQEITKEIKLTSNFLRQKGIDINCMEFKYFESKTGEKVISSDFIIGEEEYIQQKIKSASLPNINEKQFIESLDNNGKIFFQEIFNFAKENKLTFKWGSKGFSLNVTINDENIVLLFGYPPYSVFKQSIYTGFEEILRKVENSERIIEYYKDRLNETGYFVNAKSNLKWLIEKSYSQKEISVFIDIIKEIILKIYETGLKE